MDEHGEATATDYINTTTFALLWRYQKAIKQTPRNIR